MSVPGCCLTLQVSTPLAPLLVFAFSTSCSLLFLSSSQLPSHLSLVFAQFHRYPSLLPSLRPHPIALSFSPPPRGSDHAHVIPAAWPDRLLRVNTTPYRTPYSRHKTPF